MKKNLRGKIREYIQSEEGKVGAKSPLTLGVVTGGIQSTSRKDPDHESPPGFFCRDI